MSRLGRVIGLTFASLVVWPLVAWPAPAQAQFYPTLAPPNPLYQHPAYRYQFSIGPTVPTVYGRAFVGMTASPTRAPQLFSPNLYSGPTNAFNYTPWMSGARGGSSAPAVTPGYISAGSIPNSAFESAQKELERQQREAALRRLKTHPESVKDAIYEQWAYEKLGVLGLPALRKTNRDPPEELARALAAQHAHEVSDGEVLNHLLVAIVAAESAGAKGVSVHIPPQLLDQVRFAGSPTAEAINFIRRAGRLPFPVVFQEPALAEVRDDLEKEFLEAVAPLRDGKPTTPARLAKLESTVKNAQEAVTPVVRNLPFEDATAIRRFLNRLETALVAIKSSTAHTLVNPAWSKEGTGVSELVRYMTKHKLLFAPAPTGDEAGYLALHKRLATYLVSLTPPPKK